MDTDSLKNSADISSKMSNGQMIFDNTRLSPKPQRKIRINRRSFKLCPELQQNNNILTTKVDPKCITSNCTNLKFTSSTSQVNSNKKVIKLSESKASLEHKYDKSKSSILLSKSSSNCSKQRKDVEDKDNSTITVGKEPEGDPPRKKHKPITWP